MIHAVGQTKNPDSSAQFNKTLDQDLCVCVCVCGGGGGGGGGAHKGYAGSWDAFHFKCQITVVSLHYNVGQKGYAPFTKLFHSKDLITTLATHRTPALMDGP